jgi:ketosteroid isomerase-like protein
MQTDVDRFLGRFCAFGAQPGVASYLALFHPDATLFDSGMERPITVPEIPEHIEAILKLVPDFRMAPERWRVRDATVFVEAHNQATLRGEPLEWRSVYCVDLRGDQVIRGRRYYDRRPLVSRVFSGVLAQPPVAFAMPAVEHLVMSGRVDDFVRVRASAAIPDCELELLQWAGDEALVFLEWRVRGAVGGIPIEFSAAERFDLAASRVASSHCYFDSLALS